MSNLNQLDKDLSDLMLRIDRSDVTEREVKQKLIILRTLLASAQLASEKATDKLERIKQLLSNGEK